MSDPRESWRQGADDGRAGLGTTVWAAAIAVVLVLAVAFLAQRGGVESAVAEAHGGLEVDCTDAGTVPFQGSEETFYVCQRRDRAEILGCYVYTGGEIFDVSGDVRALAEAANVPVACA